MRGKLICIEGGDGVGKSTLFNNLKEEYKNGNFNFYIDDGSTELSDKIKEIVTNNKMNTISQTLLFAACRYEIYETVKQDLENGINVIMDRSYYSSIIYQGYCKGENCKYIMDVNRYIPQPDILIILDCDENEISNRMNQREELDLFEKDKRLQSIVSDGYRALYKSLIEGVKIPDNTFMVNTNGTENDTLIDVINCISEVLYYGGDNK